MYRLVFSNRPCWVKQPMCIILHWEWYMNPTLILKRNIWPVVLQLMVKNLFNSFVKTIFIPNSVQWSVHSDITKRYFKLNIIYLDNIVDGICHLTRVCYSLWLNLSRTLFDLTCKRKSVTKDILLQTKAGQKTKHRTVEKNNGKKWHGWKDTVQIVQDFSINKKSGTKLSVSGKLIW